MEILAAKVEGLAMEKYDIIIVGGGPAGLTAAIYASRMNMKTLVLESNMPGGRVVEASLIENFPGFPGGISGIELIERMIKQAEGFGAEIKFPEEVLDMNLQGIIKSITTRHNEYYGFSIIIAIGTQRKKLTVPGEVELLGRGVSYCAICDAPFFKDKEVAVVGFNDEALEDALYVSNFAKNVIVVTQNGRVDEDLLKNAGKRRTSDSKNQRLNQ
jgi:thioredoxin reductase (NADPH)